MPTIAKRHADSGSIATAVRRALKVDELTIDDAKRAAGDTKLLKAIVDESELWESTAKVPPLGAGRVRPLIWPPPASTPFASVRAAFGPLATRWGQEELSDLKSKAVIEPMVLRHLLYADSLAFPNPLDRHILDSRDSALGTLAQIVALQELIDAAVVVIVPRDLVSARAVEDAGRDLQPEVPEEETAGDLRTWSKDPFGHLSRADVNQLNLDLCFSWRHTIGEAAGQAERVGDMLATVLPALIGGGAHDIDVYLPTWQSQVALRYIINKTGALFRQGGLIELEFLPKLLELRLPRLEALTISDVIAIRRDGLFEQWQNALSCGLAAASNLPIDGLLHDEASLKRIRSELADSTNMIENEVRRSGFLARARSGAVDLTVQSAVATGGLMLITNDPRTAGVTAMLAIARIIVDWLRNRSTAGQQAYVRHAAIFQPSA